MAAPIRILLLADSHLGLDMPIGTRIARRRRGDDFLANHKLSLQQALQGEVDLVVHGGDVFDRPTVHPTLAYQAYAPLVAVAERGIPVFIVPGNHERSRLPHSRFLVHRRIHVFDRARTFVAEVRGVKVALSGFPYERHNVRAEFPQILERCGWADTAADLRLLCIHHCVEGAQVGPQDFTFTTARDVIRLRDIPTPFSATLSGHIHRQQVLTRDLRGRPLAAPVIYPGSIERTALAELHEQKGFMVLHIDHMGVRCEVRPLPARPMAIERIDATNVGASQLDAAMRAVIARVPCDAVLNIFLDGTVMGEARHVLSAAHVRSIAPSSMNVVIREEAQRASYQEQAARRRTAKVAKQLELYEQ